jgi:acetylornithine deacetylase/succinyl-diaminopimelate desuccinylase-like protein
LLDRLRQSGTRHWKAQSTRSVAFGTDASTLAAAGIPAFVFGPGSIEQAHTKDEWIAVEPLDLAVSILADWALLPLSDDI